MEDISCGLLSVKEAGGMLDTLPASTTAYRSIPFAITVPNLEYFVI